MKFEWKPGIGLYAKYDAQKIGEELSRIPTLKPQAVVDFAAANRKSELYRCFEWRDDVAGQLWRRHQAADIIRLIVVTETVSENGRKKDIVIRAFENVTDQETGSVYIHTRKALDDGMFREQILESIKNGIRELTEKGKNYSRIIANPAGCMNGLNEALRAVSNPAPRKTRRGETA